MNHKKPFFGKEIYVDREKRVIQKILSKYRNDTVDETLKKKIYKDLVKAKETGLISVPFTIIMHTNNKETHQSYVEVVLETKV